MSLAAMQQLLRHTQAIGLDRAVGAAIAYYASPETGLAFPSNDTLMRDWGFSERRIQTGLRRLEELGDLKRQRNLETRERRRVYLVAAGQLSMLDEGSAPLIRAGAKVRAGAPQGAPLAPARERTGRTNKDNTPPAPPQAGGVAFPSIPLGETAHHSSASQQPAGTRRRRRRRRAAMSDAHSATSEPCPQSTPGAVTDIEPLWAEIEAQLRQRLGDDPIDVWFSDAHAHRIEGGVLIVGLHPDTASWVRDRFARVLGSVASQRVAFVGCGRLSGRAPE